MNDTRPGHVKAEIRVTGGVVVMRRIGESDAVVARILGRSPAADGRETVWVDRLLHRSHEYTVGADGHLWKTTGAFVTELTGPFDVIDR